MPNQYVNKVQFGDQTIMDITDTSANANDVIEGEVFYNAAGTRTVGTLGDATPSTHGLMSAADKEKLDNMIDDTAGDGETGKTWSADKLSDFNRALRQIGLNIENGILVIDPATA